MAAVALAATFALAAVLTGLEPYALRLSGVTPGVPELIPVALRLVAGGAVYLIVVWLGFRIVRRT
jgi:hypothetical protein